MSTSFSHVQLRPICLPGQQYCKLSHGLARSSGVARVAAAVEFAGGAELPFVVVVVAEMQFHESRSAVSKSPLL